MKTKLKNVLTLLVGLSLSDVPVFATAKNDEKIQVFSKYTQGVQEEKKGNTLQAVRLYKSSYEVNKRDFNSLVKLGLLHMNNDGVGDLRKSGLEIAVDYFTKALTIKPEDPMVNMLIGKAYQELGLVDEAIKSLTKASTLEPENILLRENLGAIYFEQRDFKKAIEIFNKVILAYPDNLKARSYLGASLQATDNYLAAIEQYNYVLNYNPNEYSILKNVGDCWLALGQFSKAKENYIKTKDLDPNVPNIYADIAFVAKQEKDFTQAVENYKQALKIKDNKEWKKSRAYTLWAGGQVQEAIEAFDEMGEYNISGFLYQSLDKDTQAIAAYEKAIAADPKDARSRFNLARIYHEKGNLDKAKLAYEKLLEQKPGDKEAIFLLATLRQEQGDIDVAMQFYKDLLAQFNLETKALDDDSKLIKDSVYFNLGLAYKSQQDLIKAEENFEQLVTAETSPRFEKKKDVFKELSFIKIALNKNLEAEKLINSWLRDDPTSVDARNLYADYLVHFSKERQAIEQLRLASVLDNTSKTRLKLANLLHSQNNLYEALAEYQVILQKDSTNLSALLGAANNFKSLGFNEEAIGMYRETLKQYPDDVLANYNFGLLMQEAKDLQTAKVHYEKVIALNPNFAQAYYVLGLVNWDLGDKQKARQYWDTFMQTSTDESTKAQIKQIIEAGDKSSAQLPSIESGESPVFINFKQELTVKSNKKNKSPKFSGII
jgi:tetratricopeptide (TPR) repeat protein